MIIDLVRNALKKLILSGVSLLVISQGLWGASLSEEMPLSEHIENVEVLPAELVRHLPMDVNSQIAYFVKYYTTEKREVLQRWFRRCGPFLPYFRVIFREEGLPEDLVYLALVESGCNPFAVSRAGAVGIWQFIESTARLYGLKIDYWIDERKDFIKSTHAAVRYLKKLYETFGDWRLAVASYNAGEGRVSRALKARNFADYWKVMMSGAIPFETFAYLPQWLAVSIIIKDPQKYGFLTVTEDPWDFVEVMVPGGLDLRVLSLAGEMDYEILRKLNAELRREFTPPGELYPLKVPITSADKLLTNLKRLELREIKVNTPSGEVSLFVGPEDFFISKTLDQKENNSKKRALKATSEKTSKKTIKKTSEKTSKKATREKKR
jgi:membrane-bound lytic murein transglycosylase D